MIHSAHSTHHQSSETVHKGTIEEFASKEYYTTNLRPSSLAEYIGQTKLMNQLQLILKSAKLRESLPEHILFYGQPGLGKTTLASLIATELNLDMRVVSAPALQKVGDLMNILINLEKPAVVFIDEIHRLRTQVEETLYSAMEDFKVDLIMGKGVGVSTVKIDLVQFVLIGATTQFGKLSKPLRDRFPNIFKLESYSIEEIDRLLVRNSRILGVDLDAQSRYEICKRSRGVPRIANNILKRFLDLKTVEDVAQVSLQRSKEFLQELGIFEDGLTAIDIAYLQALKGGTNSLKTLSGILQEEIATIEEVIEPYVIHLGLVDKSSSGRQLTTKGRKYLGGEIDSLL